MHHCSEEKATKKATKEAVKKDVDSRTTAGASL
jgi:hypothetical protein